MEKLVTKLDTNLGAVLREQLDNNFEKIQRGLDGQSDSLNKQILGMLGNDTPQNQNEVTQARIDKNGQSYDTLKGREDATQSTAETALSEERVTAIEVKNARTNSSINRTYSTLKERMDNQENDLNNSINDKLSQINIIPETFANLSALKSKYPTGKEGIFVVVDTGHKYIWSKGLWLDAGVYQSVGILDKSITYKKIADNVLSGEKIMSTGANIFDSLNKNNLMSNNSSNTVKYKAVDDADGDITYVLETTSDYVNTSNPVINFKNAMYEAKKDFIFKMSTKSSADGSLAMIFYDANKNKIGSTQYKPFRKSDSFQETTYEIAVPKNLKYVEIQYIGLSGAGSGVNNFYINNMIGIYTDEESSNLKTKIENIENRLTSQENNENDGAFDDIPNIKHKPKKIYDISTDDVTYGSLQADGTSGVLKSNSLRVNFNESGYFALISQKSFNLKQGSYGLWIKLNRDNLTLLQQIIIKVGNTTVYQNNGPRYKATNGWNFIIFDLDSDLNGKISLSISKGTQNANKLVDVWVDGLSDTFKDNKSKIMIGFDNSQQPTYQKAFPILKQFNFPATFAWQTNQTPSSGGATINHDQFKEMVDNGWDWAMYLPESAYITSGADVSDWNSYDNIYQSLKRYVDNLNNDGVETPITYFAPHNKPGAPLIKALKALGFKAIRIAGSYDEDSYFKYYNYSDFEVKCTRISDTENRLEIVKKLIDESIAKGGYLNIFGHAIVDEPDSTGTNTSVDTFTQLINYIKHKVDLGLVDVITFKDMVNDFSTIEDRVNVIDFERLVNRVKKLEK